MVSKRAKTLMLVGGSIVGIGAIAYILANLKAKGDGIIREVYLTIESGIGGTTTPSPNTYAYAPGAIEFITALPDVGYRVEGWVINGVTSNFGTAESIPINLTEDTTVQVTFTTEPLPPPEAFPTSITNLTAEPPAAISIKQPIKGYWIFDDVTRTQAYNVIPVLDYNSNDYAWFSQSVQFQVWDDILNVPVPNISCRLYDSPRDLVLGGLGKALYRPRTGIFLNYYTLNNPLIALSDGNGKITVTFNYLIENIDLLSQEHIAYARRMGFLGAGGVYSWCLKNGDSFPYCNYAENDCWVEGGPVTTAISCPDCVPNCLDLGEQEYFNAHVFTCEVADNPGIFNICNVNCIAGIKHVA